MKNRFLPEIEIYFRRGFGSPRIFVFGRKLKKPTAGKRTPRIFFRQIKIIPTGPGARWRKCIFFWKQKIIWKRKSAAGEKVISQRKRKLFSGGSDAGQNFDFRGKMKVYWAANSGPSIFPGNTRIIFSGCRSDHFPLESNET